MQLMSLAKEKRKGQGTWWVGDLVLFFPFFVVMEIKPRFLLYAKHMQETRYLSEGGEGIVLNLFPAADLPGLTLAVKRSVRARSCSRVGEWEEYYTIAVLQPCF